MPDPPTRLAMGPGRPIEPDGRRAHRDDAWVARARKFQAALGRSGGHPGDPRGAGFDPQLHGAYLLRNGPATRRGEVEARLLAGQDDAAIAAKVSVEPGVVEAYEAIFYELRGHLKSTDWIALVAIGPRLHLGLDAGDVEVLWKVLAYNGGPFVLDALIASPPDGSGVAAADPRLAEHFGLLVATMTLVVTPDNALDVLKLHQHQFRLEREAASAVTRPVVVTADVEIGPGTPGVGRAECARQEPGSAVPGAGSVRIGPPDEGEGRLRSTA